MTDDILQRIDDTVEDAREQVCACGCGAQLSEDGPSFYYATQDCQATAMRAMTREPDEVEYTPDYSYYSTIWAEPTITSRPVQEQELSAGYERGHAEQYVWPAGWQPLGYTTEGAGSFFIHTDAAAAPAAQPDVAPPPEMFNDPGLLGYRRYCVVCGPVQPVDEYVNDDVAMDDDAGMVLYVHNSDRVLRQSCPVCTRRFPRPVEATWRWVPERRHWVLSVAITQRFARYVLGVNELAAVMTVSPDDYVQMLWQRLTDEVLGPPSTGDDTHTGQYHNPAARPAAEATYRPSPATTWSSATSNPLQDMRDFLARINLRDQLRRFNDTAAHTESALHRLFIQLGERRPEQPAESDADPEPTDVRERALWLRRHRNTGPAQRRRPPRSIDPRRAR